jgi:hypothetical protein
LGCLTLWGREGVNLTTTTEYLLNNSYIEDFYRAEILLFRIGIDLLLTNPKKVSVPGNISAGTGPQIKSAV